MILCSFLIEHHYNYLTKKYFISKAHGHILTTRENLFTIIIIQKDLIMYLTILNMVIQLNF